MAAPVVQSLAEVMQGLDPAYAQQEALINQQRAGLGAKYGAQKTGLEAAKVQGFNQINNQATGRGGSFSGVPVDEQSNYLATKYLPGIQAADAAQNEEDLGLQTGLAKIGTEKATTALNTVESQKKDLFSWNMQQEQIAAQARENAANRAAQAAQNAAKVDTGPTVNQFLQSAFAENYVGDNVKNGWTEKVLAGNLASAYGISRDDAIKLAYSYRKQYYGN